MKRTFNGKNGNNTRKKIKLPTLTTYLRAKDKKANSFKQLETSE